MALLVISTCLSGCASAGGPLTNLRSALTLYAQGRGDDAVRLMLKSWAGADTKDARAFVRWRQATRRIAKHEPRAWVPIMALYSDVMKVFLARSQKVEALALSDEIELMVQRYVQDAGAIGPGSSGDTAGHDTVEVSHSVASRMMTHVGLLLRDNRQVTRAHELLESAVSWDESNSDAHHILVSLVEKRGQLGAALEAVDHWLRNDPEHHEAHLRRGVIQARRGQDADAQAELERTMDQAPDWMAKIAFQESARLLADRGRVAEAAALVEKGLQRFPNHARLVLMRVALADDVAEAAADTTALMARRWSESYTPRVQYNNWPSHVAIRVRQQLTRDIHERLGDLRAALGEEP